MAKHENFLKTFHINLRGSIAGNPSLPKSQFGEALQALNLYHVGDKNVNKYDENNVIVGKYDSHPNFSKLQNSHTNLSRANLEIKVEVGLDELGHLHFIKVLND